MKDNHTIQAEITSPRATFESGACCLLADRPSQQDLMEEYYPLVRSVVNSMMSYLPKCADVDELHSIGVSGLVAAVQNFNSRQIGTFKAYAALRIRGSILDELRRMDTLPRTRRAKVRKLQKTVEEMEQKLGRVPRDEEIAKEMGMSMKDFIRYQHKAQPVVVVSLDNSTNEEGESCSLHEAIADDTNIPSFEKLEKAEMVQILISHIKELPEKQKKVLAMYYYEGMRLTEIAEVFGVSEARVCQIHTQAIAKLKKSFGGVL